MSEALIVTLLRHGEVEGRPDVFRGRSDPALSERGWMQMRAALAAAEIAPIIAIATSPLARCRAFAERIAVERGLPLVADDSFAEMRFGDWEELTSAQVRARDPVRYAAFRSDPAQVVPPGGEPFADFAARVRAGFARWTRGRCGHALLVTHAGVMRSLVAHTLGFPTTHLARIALPPAATCRLSLLEGEPPCLLALNYAARP